MNTADKIIAEIKQERLNQDAKFPGQQHPLGGGGHYEEIANQARRSCERHVANGSLTWLDIISEEVFEAFAEVDVPRAREEYIQVAALALAIIEAIDEGKTR